MDSYFIHNKTSRTMLTCRLHLYKESSCSIRPAQLLSSAHRLMLQGTHRLSCLHSSIEMSSLYTSDVFSLLLWIKHEIQMWLYSETSSVILCLTRHNEEAPPAGDSQSLHALNEPLSQSLIINILIHAKSENVHNDEVTSCLWIQVY